MVLLVLISWTCSLPARDKTENWIEVSSPHFVVATNGNEKQARRIADQFERMRSLFHSLFPKLKIEQSSPIVVLAVKDDKDFRSLEPAEYLAKGSLRLAGLFLRAPEKNYVLMRLEAEGEHPYATIYHEYTHLVMGKAEWMPLWMNEGLAEFYQNTDIDEDDARLGQPSIEDLRFLRQTRLLPLPILFAVDSKSPYYHEENKGSIFYAESWALTHYILVTDYQQKTNRLERYADLLASGADGQSAATAAFGDLKQLQASLDNYVQRASFTFFKKKVSTDADPASFKLESITPSEADTLRADFLAYNRRTEDARALLDRVLHDDPKNVLAHETMGYLAFREGHIPEARQWYQQAVELDSRSYLSHYYFAVMAMQESLDASTESEVENSLRQSIKLNPSFAPAFDRLAVFLGMRHRNLDEAHMMGLTAVTLEPTNVGYRVNVANVLMQMQQGQNAVNVLRNAAKLAQSQQETELLTQALLNAENYATAQAEAAERQQRYEETEKSEAALASESSSDDKERDDAEPPQLVRRSFVPSGPHRFVTGVLDDVRCKSSSMDLSLKSGAKTMNFHSDNYYKIQFSVLGFQPQGDLKPCDELEGRPAKVEYVESADKSQRPQLLSVELHK